MRACVRARARACVCQSLGRFLTYLKSKLNSEHFDCGYAGVKKCYPSTSKNRILAEAQTDQAPNEPFCCWQPRCANRHVPNCDVNVPSIPGPHHVSSHPLTHTTDSEKRPASRHAGKRTGMREMHARKAVHSVRMVVGVQPSVPALNAGRFAFGDLRIPLCDRGHTSADPLHIERGEGRQHDLVRIGCCGIPAMVAPVQSGPSEHHSPKRKKTRTDTVTRGGGSEGEGGGLAGTPFLLGSPYGPRQKAGRQFIILNPLGAEGANVQFWLSASNIGRGGGGGSRGGGRGSKGGGSSTSLGFGGELPPPPSPTSPNILKATVGRGTVVCAARQLTERRFPVQRRCRLPPLPDTAGNTVPNNIPGEQRENRKMGGNGGTWGEMGGTGETILGKLGGMGKNVETKEKLESQPADTQPLCGSRTTFSGV